MRESAGERSSGFAIGGTTSFSLPCLTDISDYMSLTRKSISSNLASASHESVVTCTLANTSGDVIVTFDPVFSRSSDSGFMSEVGLDNDGFNQLKPMKLYPVCRVRLAHAEALFRLWAMHSKNKPLHAEFN